MLDTCTIIAAISKRNRVTLVYKNKLYNKVEIYVYGYGKNDKEYLRIYDNNSLKWKLLVCDNIQKILLRENDHFNILQNNYNLSEDKVITKRINFIKLYS